LHKASKQVDRFLAAARRRPGLIAPIPLKRSIDASPRERSVEIDQSEPPPGSPIVIRFLLEDPRKRLLIRREGDLQRAGTERDIDGATSRSLKPVEDAVQIGDGARREHGAIALDVG
jgi:hypothetical protein